MNTVSRYVYKGYVIKRTVEGYWVIDFSESSHFRTLTKAKTWVDTITKIEIE